MQSDIDRLHAVRRMAVAGGKAQGYRRIQRDHLRLRQNDVAAGDIVAEMVAALGAGNRQDEIALANNQPIATCAGVAS